MRGIRCMMLTCVLLAACAGTPPTLIALPAAPNAGPAAAEAPKTGITLLLRRVTVPGHLDGFAVVTGRRGQAITVADDAEWAERLSDAAARVLRDALSQRLGPGRVLIEGDGRLPDADLTVEFFALEPAGNGTLTLDARWSFVATSGERASHAGRTRLDVPLTSADASAVAAATAQALGRLAAILAQEAPNLYADASNMR